MRTVPFFSIIVPSRGRPDGLRRLLDSFKATTNASGALEIVIVVDADDESTRDFSYDGLSLKKVVVEPGLKMGALNMAGYRETVGKYVMLLNDDVIVRTPGWDEKVLAAFRSFADGIVLVHVNDKIFEEKLCTFPFLSRTYCELAGGICPGDYVRYRIDDHIYNVFNLLAVLGEIRILYLPEVVFEHTNYVLTSLGSMEYKPIESIHKIDTELFHGLLPARKELAHRLMDHLDRESVRDRRRIRQNLLAPIVDSVALRRPEYIRVHSNKEVLSSDNTRVTIGVVSANVRSDHARSCIDLVKKFTRNFDLIVVDNNGSASFNHSREMNRLISMCQTDHLILLDDDVMVEPGWLDGLLRCMSESVGIVTPLHKNLGGNLSYAGVVMSPDYSGHHTHCLEVSSQPMRIETICSAAVLIDISKCGRLRFDESYSKYFLDIDFGLQVWSSGLEVVCSPFVAVTHIGGATLRQGSALSRELFEVQRQHFVREWVETGRYRALEEGIWRTVPELRWLVSLPSEIEGLLKPPSDGGEEGFRARALETFRRLKQYPMLAQWAAARLWSAVSERRPELDDPEWGHLGFLLGCIAHPVLVEQDFAGLNIVLYDAEFYALPQTEGVFDHQRIARGDYSRYYQAESLEVLKARIRGEAEAARPRTIKDSKDCNPDGWQAPRPLWRSLHDERTRFGSWRSAFRVVGKPLVKQKIIETFGWDAFLQMKTAYGVVKHRRRWREHRFAAKGNFSADRDQPVHLAQMKSLVTVSGPEDQLLGGFPISSEPVGQHPATPSVGNSQIESLRGATNGSDFPEVLADAQRWVDASPVTLADANYRGYSIYRYEYKFFAVPEDAGGFNYHGLQQAKDDPRLIGHSLCEVRAAVDRLLRDQGGENSLHSLVLACAPSPQLKPILDRAYCAEKPILLVDADSTQGWGDFPLIVSKKGTVLDWARTQGAAGSGELSRRLLREKFERVILPWLRPDTWTDNCLEAVAARLSNYVEVLCPSGERRSYRGENLHRLLYNKAYLASMFEVIPWPSNKTVLEVGCSDGMVCDILALLGTRKVVGIDVMTTVGCGFPNPAIEYQRMDIADLAFPDQSFDISLSIATFEHLIHPYEALLEMLRVTKVGGYSYIQAGPLYHSPFGHHMFGYFQDCPWIHLRKSKDGIIAWAKARGVDQAIARDLYMSCEDYIDGMLNRDHINGLLLEDYHLKEFCERPDVEILKCNVSFEGKELLTPEIIAEIPRLNPDRLVEHGFELAFRRVK